MEMNNFMQTELPLLTQKLADLDSSIQEIRAFVDQKFSHIESDIENLESRISNLR
jgi:predicted transposase YdaD